MDLLTVLSHKVKKEEIKLGDHIYTYRAGYTYSHHGIYVGGSRVIHFTPDHNCNLSTPSSSSFNFTSLASSSSSSFNFTSLASSSSSSFNYTSLCPFDDCGFRLANYGVTLSCLDCFLGSGSPRLYQYGVSKIAFLVRVRGGTCTMAKSDPLETVIHRAIYCLSQIGFGKYDLVQNNCEDFALYCKTGLMDRCGSGSSGQTSSFFGTNVGVAVSIPVAMLASTPVGAAMSVGLHCWSRYKTYRNDIGVSKNVVEVPLEDLAAKFCCKADGEEG
ncbi:hypothetical protein vseg_004532 [Gypsophila vaccaria]